jgi:hypothetical protein
MPKLFFSTVLYLFKILIPRTASWLGSWKWHRIKETIAITFSVPRRKVPAQLRRSDALNLAARAVRTRPDFRI